MGKPSTTSSRRKLKVRVNPALAALESRDFTTNASDKVRLGGEPYDGKLSRTVRRAG